MADSVCAGLSEENDPKHDDYRRVKCAWTPVLVSRKKSPSEMKERRAETLGFYETDAVKDEPNERSGPAEDSSLLRFMCAELTRGYFPEHNEAKYTERRERVYTCMRIPRELERLMVFGFFLCLDAFLYVFTLLPLRTLLAVLRLLTIPCCGLGYHTHTHTHHGSDAKAAGN